MLRGETKKNGENFDRFGVKLIFYSRNYLIFE